MSETVTLSLAKLGDAERIARMSRDLIEVGLGWRWTAARVATQIRCPDTCVVVARTRQRLIGFAIMHFLTVDAHLLLLAVHPSWQRLGIGQRLIEWLEKSARVAGITSIHLEVRASNKNAQTFYRALGYRETTVAPRYYNSRESALRMIHNLRVTP